MKGRNKNLPLREAKQRQVDMTSEIDLRGLGNYDVFKETSFEPYMLVRCVQLDVLARYCREMNIHLGRLYDWELCTIPSQISYKQKSILFLLTASSISKRSANAQFVINEYQQIVKHLRPEQTHLRAPSLHDSHLLTVSELSTLTFRQIGLFKDIPGSSISLRHDQRDILTSLLTDEGLSSQSSRVAGD